MKNVLLNLEYLKQVQIDRSCKISNKLLLSLNLLEFAITFYAYVSEFM